MTARKRKYNTKGRPLTTKEARAMSEARETYAAGPGRPRKKGRRCPCGENTLKRAKARNFDCCKRNGIESVQSQTKKQTTKRK
jgi:hypothetical protein